MRLFRKRVATVSTHFFFIANENQISNVRSDRDTNEWEWRRMFFFFGTFRVQICACNGKEKD